MSEVTSKFDSPAAQGIHVVRDLDELREGLDSYRYHNKLVSHWY